MRKSLLLPILLSMALPLFSGCLDKPSSAEFYKDGWKFKNFSYYLHKDSSSPRSLVLHRAWTLPGQTKFNVYDDKNNGVIDIVQISKPNRKLMDGVESEYRYCKDLPRENPICSKARKIFRQEKKKYGIKEIHKGWKKKLANYELD